MILKIFPHDFFLSFSRWEKIKLNVLLFYLISQFEGVNDFINLWILKNLLSCARCLKQKKGFI